MDKMKMTDDQLDQVSGGTMIPYQVQAGDCLNDIAKKFNVSVDQLIKWNNIQNPNVLTVGQQIKVKF